MSLPPPPPDHNFHPAYRPDIDGLRAVAILSVVIFHAFPLRLTGGFVGVDIFFVISGFLISSIIFKSLMRGDFSFTEFYAHRIKRIFPALTLVLLASFTFGWFALFPSEFAQLGMHMAASAGFVENFALWKESGYFDIASELKPLLHLWSLAIEEQYYLIYPLLIWAGWRMGLNILTIVILLSLLSFKYNIAEIEQNPIKTFFSPQTRFWELLAGSVLAYCALNYRSARLIGWLRWLIFNKLLFSRIPKTEQCDAILRNVFSAIGFLAIAFTVISLDKSKLFPGWWALLPVIGSIFIILAGPRAWINRKILSNRLMVFIGLISYPLYLWHWPLLSFAQIVESGKPALSVRIVALILSFILAWLTYQLLEKPIRFGKKSWEKTALLLALMSLLGFLGYYTYKHKGLEFRQINQENNAVIKEFEGMIPQYAQNDICRQKYQDERMIQIIDKYHNFFCILNKAENPTLLLLGNSFANHLYAGLANNPQFKNNTILSYGICDAAEPAEPEDKTGWGFNQEPHPCAKTGKLIEQSYIDNIIKSSGSVTYTIISGLDFKPDQKYISRLLKRIAFLSQNNIKIVIFVPHVFLHQDYYSPVGCFGRPFASPKFSCELPAKLRTDLLMDFQPLMNEVKKQYPNVLFFDQNVMFCDDNKCSLVKNHLPLFRDTHLTEYGSMEMGRAFAEWATINLPEILAH